MEKFWREIGLKLSKTIFKRPKIYLSISLIALISLGIFSVKLNSYNDYRYFFSDENPMLQDWNNLQGKYTQDDSVYILLGPKKGELFSKEHMVAIKELTDRSWKVPFNIRVDSLTNFQHIKAIEDDIEVRDLIEDPENMSPEDFIKAKYIAVNEPLMINRLVDPKGKFAAVNISISIPGKDLLENKIVTDYVKKMIDQFEKDYPLFDIHATGIILLNQSFFEVSHHDMVLLTPLMLGIIVLVMFVFFKSITSVFVVVSAIVLAMFGGLGFAGLFNIPITPPSALAPSVILTLAVANSIHFLVTMFENLQKMGKREAIIESLRVNIAPIFLSTLTTIIGFLSLNSGDSRPFGDFGNISSIGVAISFFVTIVVLPLIVYFMPVKDRSSRSVSEDFFLKNFYVKIAEFVIRRKFLIFWSSFIALIFFSWQIPKIELNDHYVGYFDKTVKFRQDSDFINDHMTGVYQLQYDIKSGAKQGVTDPAFLYRLEEFVKYARSFSDVDHVYSVADIMKKLNMSMHGDQEEYYQMPKDKALAAQYLLLYEMSLPYGLDVNNILDIDKSSARVIITVENSSTKRIIELSSIFEKWLAENTPEPMHAKTVGVSFMFSHVTEINVRSMAKGVILAFILIIIVMMIALRSVKYGIISIVPNLVPTAMTLGIWSLVVGEAGLTIAIVTSVTIGIIVDDTIHYLSKYARAKKEKNYSTKDALIYTFSHVGAALFITTVLLTLGFLAHTLSTFQLNWTLGILSSSTIVVALILDFFMLPTLLLYFDDEDSLWMKLFSKKKK